MVYHIWDTPDYEDLDKKMWFITKFGIGYSTAYTLWRAVSNVLPRTASAILIPYARTLIPNVIALNLGCITAYTTAKLRGNLDDKWNYLPASFVFAASCSLLRPMKILPVPQTFAYYFIGSAAWSIIAKHAHKNRTGSFVPSMPWLPDMSEGAYGGVRYGRPGLENLSQDWGRREF